VNCRKYRRDEPAPGEVPPGAKVSERNGRALSCCLSGDSGDVHFLAAQMLVHDDLARLESLAENLHSKMRLRGSAHENVESRVSVFGPAVDADVRLSKHGNARHAAIRREVMHVDVQERGACDVDAFPEGILDMLKIV
jgi:hypothetical protein